MANPLCLPKQHVQKFLQALKDKTLNPEELAKMTSEERLAKFEPIVGKDNAEFVNRTFEQKMLTKDIQRSMVTWAKNVAGLKPEVRQDMVSRIERMDERILNPADEASFLKDLAGQKLGANVTFDEVKKVNDLTDALKKAKAELGNNRRQGNQAAATPEEQAYGAAARDLETYIEALKLQSGDQSFAKNAANFAWGLPMRGLTFGHGGVIPFTHARNSAYTPGEAKIFAKTVLRAYGYLTTKRFGELPGASDRYEKEMVALRSHPLYDTATKYALEVQAKSKPVGLGYSPWTDRAFDALKTMRMDLFEKYWNSLDKDMQTDEMGKSLAKTINHATGVANTPPVVAKVTSKIMFAPKLRVAKYLSAFVDPFTSKVGAQRAAKMVAVNIGLLMVNDMVNRFILNKTGDDTVNWTNPDRADWLRMKVGGMTLPMAPTFEALRLPVRAGAVLLDPKENDKGKVLKNEVISGLHPAIPLLYGAATGKEMWSGKTLPFKGASQYIYGEHRNQDEEKQLSGKEFASGFAPIPVQPVLKEMSKNGLHMDNLMGPPIVESILSAFAGEHAYENIQYKKPAGAKKKIY